MLCTCNNSYCPLKGSEHTIRKMLDKAVKEYNVNLHPMSMWSTNRGDRELKLHSSHYCFLTRAAATWSNSLTKLHIFALTDYKRVIYFDSDGIVLNNLDHLFLAPEARIALRKLLYVDCRHPVFLLLFYQHGLIGWNLVNSPATSWSLCQRR